MVLGRKPFPTRVQGGSMAQAKREKVQKYAGVYFRIDEDTKERTYYIMYRIGGRGAKLIEEPVGKSSTGMTGRKASLIRADRIRGTELPNTEKRKEAVKAKAADQSRWTIERIWLLYESTNADKPTTRTDRYFVRYLSDLFQRIPSEITTQHIDILRKKLTNTPSKRLKKGQVVNLAPQTIKHILELLRRLINFAVSRDICLPPTQLHFTMPRVDNQKTEMLTDAQLAHLLQALDEEADQDAAAFIRLALVTGMRKGALMALRWDDCDFEHNVITLRGEAAKKGTTEFSPMTASARAVLESIQNRTSPFVFPGRDGKQRTDYRRIARRVKEKAGLPADFRPLHGLRHNFASRLASSGQVELYVIQKLLTHSSPQMTQRYAHLQNETLMKAASLADTFLLEKKDDSKDDSKNS
jgi:integrase